MGDVLFFDINENGEVNVVVIYIGDDEMIYVFFLDGKVVVKNILSSVYWLLYFVKVKWIIGVLEIVKDNEVIVEVLKYFGILYVFGGELLMDGFDCFVFVVYVF